MIRCLCCFAREAGLPFIKAFGKKSIELKKAVVIFGDANELLLRTPSEINAGNGLYAALFGEPVHIENGGSVVDVCYGQLTHTFSCCFLQQAFGAHRPELKAVIGVAV